MIQSILSHKSIFAHLTQNSAKSVQPEIRNGNFDQIYQYTRLIIKHEVLIDQQDIYYIKKF